MSIKTLYVSKYMDTFDFLSMMAMEKSAITVIYISDEFPEDGADSSIPDLLDALVTATEGSEGQSFDYCEDDNPFEQYSATGQCRNESIHDLLWALAYTLTDNGVEQILVTERTCTTQVLPFCYVHFRLGLAFALKQALVE